MWLLESDRFLRSREVFMKQGYLARSVSAYVLVLLLISAPLSAVAQTEIKMPKNKYKVQDDVKIGNEYSAKVENEFPLVRDRRSAGYIESVGQRLVRAIPQEFQQPAFRYRFKIVNASDINAFALPGGPMYVNRGMIEAANNEGEMAGVMAHEISHVALRHGTAQATKQSNPLNQILGIGAIIGGAIVGGQAGAQLGALFAAGYFLKYSRRYENQADILGARIMADSGYDPRDLANMFRIISAESKGGRPPEWLSSHPDPDKRYKTINREAELLRVSENPTKMTRGFAQTKTKLQSLPPARTMAEIQKGAKGSGSGNETGGGGGGNTGMSGGRYRTVVASPSSRTRSYRAGNWVRMRVPRNWKEFPGSTEVWFAPEGAYGKDGITHGALAGIYTTQQNTLERATEEYVNSVLSGNNYLRQTTGYSRTSISGRRAYATRLSGRSPVTGRTEYALIYTTRLRNGNLFYVVGVAPQNESYRYNRAFNNLVRSVRLYE